MVDLRTLNSGAWGGICLNTVGLNLEMNGQRVQLQWWYINYYSCQSCPFRTLCPYALTYLWHTCLSNSMQWYIPEWFLSFSKPMISLPEISLFWRNFALILRVTMLLSNHPMVIPELHKPIRLPVQYSKLTNFASWKDISDLCPIVCWNNGSRVSIVVNPGLAKI